MAQPAPRVADRCDDLDRDMSLDDTRQPTGGRNPHMRVQHRLLLGGVLLFVGVAILSGCGGSTKSSSSPAALPSTASGSSGSTLPTVKASSGSSFCATIASYVKGAEALGTSPTPAQVKALLQQGEAE